jgi:GNAT superfamily N-acetyltransferase
VPVRQDPDGRPTSRLLTDDAGRPLARFREAMREGRRFADLFEPVGGTPADALVGAALRDLAGWRVASSPALGRKLIAAGASRGRHAHVMRRSLAAAELTERGRFPGVRIGPIDCPAADLAPAMHAAVPPGHADFEPGDEEIGNVAARLQRLCDGTEAGPLQACSRVAVDPGGRVRGAALVTEIAVRELPMGGLWLTELFREPGWTGLGAALLRAALRQAAADGHAAIGLAVSDGNAARGLYEANGFELVSSWLSVDLPANEPISSAVRSG